VTWLATKARKHEANSDFRVFAFSWFSSAVFVSVLICACGAAPLAHELGTTRVSILLQAGQSYDVEIVTDAAALVEKLEASSGRSPVVDARPDRLQRRLASFDEPFRQRVKLTFDATQVRPAIAYAVSPSKDAGGSPTATIRLTGPIPPGASHVTWSYAWTFASYAVTIRSASSRNPTTEWLEGGQNSAPVALASTAPPVDRLATARRYLVLGFTHIVPGGLDHMLFVLGMSAHSPWRIRSRSG
jgi:hypothetical protein